MQVQASFVFDQPPVTGGVGRLLVMRRTNCSGVIAFFGCPTNVGSTVCAHELMTMTDR